MIVIADTSLVNHLILIEQDPILRALYGRVVVSRAVVLELQAPAAPPNVHAWIDNPPNWLEVNDTPFADEPALAHLDAGERDAILLAQSLKADVVLIDDLGRRQAGCRNHNVAGTLTVLYLGAGSRSCRHTHVTRAGQRFAVLKGIFARFQ